MGSIRTSFTRLFPELAGDLERIDAGRLPPGSLDTDAVDRAVMHAPERHGEFVAWFATGLLRAWFWLRCKRLAHGHAQIGSRRGIRLVATLLPISDCSKPNMERGRELLLCELQCAADDTDPRHGARTRPLRIGHRGNSDMPASSLTGDRIGRSGYATLQDGQKQGPITFSLIGHSSRCFPGFKHVYNIIELPTTRGDAGGHCGSAPQTLVNANEVVMEKMER